MLLVSVGCRVKGLSLFSGCLSHTFYLRNLQQNGRRKIYTAKARHFKLGNEGIASNEVPFVHYALQKLMTLIRAQNRKIGNDTRSASTPGRQLRPGQADPRPPARKLQITWRLPLPRLLGKTETWTSSRAHGAQWKTTVRRRRGEWEGVG